MKGLPLVVLCMALGDVFGQFNPKPDSLINKFGPKTTNYFLEEDYLLNQTLESRSLDTVLLNSHLFQSYYSEVGKPHQDLGAYGSSRKAYYLEMPTELGVGLGIHTFDGFGFSPRNIEYYDTHSPFARLEYIWGFDGQHVINAKFSRSAGENFNIGFDMKRFVSDRLVGRNPNEDSFTDHLSINTNIRFQTTNKRYVILASYRFMDHEQNEHGGFYKPSDGYNYFEDDNAATRLYEPVSNYKQNGWHVYQQFSLSKDSTLAGKVQLFHVFDRNRTRYSYVDDKLDEQRLEIENQSNYDFYGTAYFDSTATLDSTIFHVFENKGGLKGTLGNTYYQAYYRNRTYKYSVFDTLHYGWNQEHYIGGHLKHNLKDSVLIGGYGEIAFSGTGMYKLGAYTQIKGFGFKVETQHVAPSMLEHFYVSNHFLYSKAYSNYQMSQVEASYKLTDGSSYVKPMIGVDLFKDYIYFDQTALPKQFDGSIEAPYAGVDFLLKLGRFHLTGFTKYYKPSEDVIRTPEIFSYNQIYYESHFKNALNFQVGFDCYLRSSFYAYDYSPANQQFHLQDDFKNNTYFVADFFINFRVKSALLFMKVPNLNSIFTNKGYEITPNYPGVGSTLVLGVDWMFFD